MESGNYYNHLLITIISMSYMFWSKTEETTLLTRLHLHIHNHPTVTSKHLITTYKISRLAGKMLKLTP